MKRVNKTLIAMALIAISTLAFAGPASAGSCCGGSTYFKLNMQESKVVSVFLGTSGMEMQVYTDPIPPENDYVYYLCLCVCSGAHGSGTECSLSERHSDTKFDNTIDPGCIFNQSTMDCHCGQNGCHHP